MHFAVKPVLQFICDYLHDQRYLCATFLSVHNKSEICTGKIVYCFSITSLIEQKDRSQFPIQTLTPACIAFSTRRMRALHICGFATLFSTIAFAKPRLHIPRMLPTSICKSYFCLFTQTLFIYAKETFQENTSYPPSIYWHNLHPLHPHSLWGTALHRKLILQNMTNDVGAPLTNSLLHAFFISITIRASRNMDTPAFKLMVD